MMSTNDACSVFTGEIVEMIVDRATCDLSDPFHIHCSLVVILPALIIKPKRWKEERQSEICRATDHNKIADDSKHGYDRVDHLPYEVLINLRHVFRESVD